MNVALYSLANNAQFEVESLTIQTPMGSCMIYAGHAPMIAPLLPQQSIELVLSNGLQKRIFVLQGLIQVTRSLVTLLVTEWHEEDHRAGVGRITV